MTDQIVRRRRALSGDRVLRTLVVGALLAGSAVAANMPGAQAAPVPCSASALVSAVGAVASSGGTVTLTAGCTYTMTTVNSTADGPSGFADILGNVTVVGNGATIERSSAGGTPDFRFFIVDDGGALTISNVTLSNGSITNDNSQIHGGAAIINRSVLNANGVTFLNNHEQTAVCTPTPCLPGAGGGAIDNHDKGVLTVTNSTFSGNSAPQGGAIEDEGTLCHMSVQSPQCGQSTVTNSTFTNNSTTNYGGAGFESQLDSASPAQCVGSPPFLAECQEVGGAHDYLTGDTFTGNTSTGEGGAIANFGTTAVLNSTIYNNTAGTAGGGGLQNTGTLTITFSTVDANTSAFGSDVHSFTDVTHMPGKTTITMSIISAGSTVNCGGSVAMTDGGYNIDSGTSCGFTINAQNSTNPNLGSLASNGGPTQTMAVTGAPAVDAIPGGTAGCGGTDQRGAPRPQNGACDIGAFEYDTTPPSVPTGVTAVAISPNQVNVSWNASSDPLGVTNYDIYRDGSLLATVGSQLTYSDTTVAISTTYHYQVDAIDGAGNQSAKSTPPVAVTTPNVVYYFNWFDLASPGMKADNIHLLNTSGTTANVVVSMPGATPINVSVPTGTQTYVSFGPGHIGGPVVVSSDQVIRATQRVEYNSTFNEVNAKSTAQAAVTSYINWFDKASAGMYNDNIHLLNPGGTTAHVTVSIQGFAPQMASVSPGAEAFVTFPAGTIGGPVAINSDQPILASQRVQYYGSFNEVWAESSARAVTTSYVNWFDKASPGMLNDNIHLLNPGATSSDVTVSVPGAPDQHATVAAGGEAYVTFPAGTMGGPVTINATQPVLASSRVQYYSTFNEVWAQSGAEAATTKYVLWYDKASAGMMNDNIHLLNPGGTVAHVQVSIGGAPVQNATVAAGGGEAYVTFPNGTIGGPVTITSDQPILASQRVQYYASFNENWAA